MEKELKDKLDRLVRKSRLDQAQLLLQKAGYTEHYAGLLIHCALKATLTQVEIPLLKLYDDGHICTSCG